MKKILYILPSLESGGAEKASVMVANALCLRYSLTFFLFKKGGVLGKSLDRKIKIAVHQLYDDRTTFSRIYTTYVRIPFALVRYIRENDFDTVVSAFELGPEIPVMILSIWCRLTQRRNRIRFVSIIQNSITGVLGTRRRNGIAMKIVSLCRSIVFDNIVAVSESIALELLPADRRRITIIPNPVDRSEILNHSTKELPLSLQHITNGSYFINVARISKQKNQMFLLRAMNSVARMIPEKLVIAGLTTDEVYKKELEKYISENGLEDRIMFTGALENHFPLLVKSKALVNSSMYEGVPLAILETMAVGKCILSTKFVGYENLLTEENSLLAETESEFADYMVQLSRNSLAVEHRIERAKKDVQRYDISLISEQYHQLFV